LSQEPTGGNPYSNLGPDVDSSTRKDSTNGIGPQISPGTQPRTLLLVIAYLGFISLGLPDTVAGVAWPSIRETFELSQSSFGLVFIALGCGYCSSSFLGGTLSSALGIGKLLTFSSALVVTAMFVHSLAGAWPILVASAVIWGLGSGAIDAGLNTYVSKHFSARHMNWLHACYSLGATIGPLLMTGTIVRAGSWRAGYAVVGCILLTMTGTFLWTRRLWDDPVHVDRKQSPANVRIRDVLRVPLVWLQVAAFFVYTGLEFTVGQWCFTVLTESRGVPSRTAGILVGCYFGAIGVGRLLLGAIVDHVGPDRLVRFSTFLTVIGTIMYASVPEGLVSQASLVLIGLGLAPVFPCMMARTPARLSDGHASHAIGFQVSAATLGAATIPAVAGLLAESWDLQAVAWFSVVLAAILFLVHEFILRMTQTKTGHV
jgi:fucose permease